MNGNGLAAIVTGAAGGIGRATCELLAETGWHVVAADRDADKLAWTNNSARIHGEVADIAIETDNERLVAKCEEQFGGVDAVILNAALSLTGTIDNFAMADFDRLMEVNVRGTVLGIRAALPALRRRGGGSITLTGSTHGLGGDANFWAYSASKHALIGIVKSVAREVGAQGIRINAVCPGPTRATGLSNDFEEKEPELFRELARAIPLQRWGEPREIAAALAFVASPAASFVHGVAMPVDGGTLSGSGCLPPSPPPT
jgi:NAD(P)-dependent dehydrogenase (short-subunit alcohol dehydrogenase family)